LIAFSSSTISEFASLFKVKTFFSAVDQAVLLNDQSVLVDLLTVITLRPSIWNLDLCTALLPSLEKLLQSKYEM
jgi:katanin p80 WD40 repeat-containing subunit B1